MPNSTVTPEHDAFLAANRWALVATTSPSGTPQVTLVAYHWDGSDAVVSTRSGAVKWRNLLRNPRVAFTITDDHRFLTVSGTADLVTEDPAREDLTRRLQASLLPAHAALLEEDFDKGLDAAHRVVIRLRPARVIGRI